MPRVSHRMRVCPAVVGAFSIALAVAGCSVGTETGSTTPYRLSATEPVRRAGPVPPEPVYGSRMTQQYSANTQTTGSIRPATSAVRSPPRRTEIQKTDLPPLAGRSDSGGYADPAASRIPPASGAPLRWTESPRAPPRIDGGRIVEVQSGDSLAAIAARNGVSVSELIIANDLRSPDVRPGQRLAIPPSRSAYAR